ncbi:hypothetical protein RFI_01382 [Reticulomyxa filosa]|uniref:TFIIB-type domain-containing protein n=1 Tax=Reticulomyxa filosa TaxID=46433 RepID=X6PDC5_RETFI|nr:hypothetical protein RFI_01382 [Reticulomyxa filosa]|eukprot:ETO35677.1 hypothetical protein RFI_01382 [Reticulomyxa filosa]
MLIILKFAVLSLIKSRKQKKRVVNKEKNFFLKMDNILFDIDKTESEKQECPNCGPTKITYDMNSYDKCCTKCGCVLEDQFQIEFDLNRKNIDDRSGYYQKHDESGAMAAARSPKDVAVREVESIMYEITQQLGLKRLEAVCQKAMQITQKLTVGYKKELLACVCLYMSCRDQKQPEPYLLIDFATAIKVNVFRLARAFCRICHGLRYQLPTLNDPVLYVDRFVKELNFGDKTAIVANTTFRLVMQMKKEWIDTGRRPAGIVGACILVAARIHGFHCTTEDIVRVAKVSIGTIQTRIREFLKTPSASLHLSQIVSDQPLVLFFLLSSFWSTYFTVFNDKEKTESEGMKAKCKTETNNSDDNKYKHESENENANESEIEHANEGEIENANESEIEHANESEIENENKYEIEIENKHEIATNNETNNNHTIERDDGYASKCDQNDETDEIQQDAASAFNEVATENITLTDLFGESDAEESNAGQTLTGAEQALVDGGHNLTHAVDYMGPQWLPDGNECPTQSFCKPSLNESGRHERNRPSSGIKPNNNAQPKILTDEHVFTNLDDSTSDEEVDRMLLSNNESKLKASLFKKVNPNWKELKEKQEQAYAKTQPVFAVKPVKRRLERHIDINKVLTPLNLDPYDDDYATHILHAIGSNVRRKLTQTKTNTEIADTIPPTIDKTDNNITDGSDTVFDPMALLDVDKNTQDDSYDKDSNNYENVNDNDNYDNDNYNAYNEFDVGEFEDDE